MKKSKIKKKRENNVEDGLFTDEEIDSYNSANEDNEDLYEQGTRQASPQEVSEEKIRSQRNRKAPTYTDYVFLIYHEKVTTLDRQN